MIWTIAETAILLILWILRRTVPGIPAAIPARTAAGIPGRTRRRIAAGIKHTTAAGTIWITAAEISRLQQEKGRLLREDGLFCFIGNCAYETKKRSAGMRTRRKGTFFFRGLSNRSLSA